MMLFVCAVSSMMRRQLFLLLVILKSHLRRHLDWQWSIWHELHYCSGIWPQIHSHRNVRLLYMSCKRYCLPWFRSTRFLSRPNVQEPSMTCSTFSLWFTLPPKAMSRICLIHHRWSPKDNTFNLQELDLEIPYLPYRRLLAYRALDRSRCCHRTRVLHDRNNTFWSIVKSPSETQQTILRGENS